MSELTADTLIRIPGSNKPVKFGDFYRGLQADYTRKSQAAAEYQRQLEAATRELQAARSQTQAPRQESANPLQALVQKLQSEPYLSGQAAAEVIGTIASQLQESQQHLSKRDQAIMYLGQEFDRISRIVGQLNGASTESAFNQKIAGWMQELNLPKGAEDFVKETYLAYEGPDLDVEFPRILRERWDGLQRAIRAMDRERVESQRKKPFVPRRGGTATAGKPLERGFKSPAQVADELWDAVRDE